MATILQLSEKTYVNVDAIMVVRREDREWRVWMRDTKHILALTSAEADVLIKYFSNDAIRNAYEAVTGQHKNSP